MTDSNFIQPLINQITQTLGLSFIPEQDTEGNVCFANSTELRDDYKMSFAPIDILDYIYAVLHSPTYRETYKEFLKIDFPRVPYPKDASTFWDLVKLGGELRQLHLLESASVENYITSYPEAGDNIVTRKMTKTSIGFETSVIARNEAISQSRKTEVKGNDEQIATSHVPRNDVYGKVWINDTQYFDNVPLIAWEFYIGGYQPAQKWLKDRNGRTLTFEDILHYQKIIVAVTETDRLMKAIDTIKLD